MYNMLSLLVLYKTGVLAIQIRSYSREFLSNLVDPKIHSRNRKTNL